MIIMMSRQLLPRYFYHALVGLLGIFFVVSPANAAELNRTTIRLDRQKALVAPGRILILLRPSSATTETGIKVVVGNAFSINNTASSFTVATSNLPDGVSAVPGIGTAHTANGQTLIFPTSDLNPSTTYGFYISNGFNTNPNAGDGEAYLWSVATQNASGDVDTATAMVPIVTNDQITVTGAVPAQSSYLTTATTLLTEGNNIAQNQELTYQITYGTTLAQPSDLTLQAQWSLGTLEGSGTPSINVLDYILGSASQAYGGSTPIVDLQNRTLTWNIENFPANTQNASVTFKLKTKTGYTGDQLVSFDVLSKITSPAVTTTQTVTKNYQYDHTLEPSPSPTTNTSLPKSSPTPTPTPSPSPAATTSATPALTTTTPNLHTISVTTVTTTQAGIAATTSTPQTLRIEWGDNPNNLTLSQTSPQPQRDHQFSLSNLLPDTRYYFRFVILSENKTIISTSDLFTFSTAKSTQTPIVSLTNISHRGISLLENRNFSNTETTQLPLLTIPQKSKSEFEFRVEKYELIKELYIELRGPLEEKFPTNVKAYTAIRLPIQTLGPGHYVAVFDVPETKGTYEAVLQISDINGNYLEKTVTELLVTSPITVINSKTNKPIERARVEIGVYNSSKRLYDYFDRSIVFPEYDNLTDANGQLFTALPPGKFQLEITAVGYDVQEVEFELKGNKTDAYPTIYLNPQPFSLLATLHYYSDTALHYWHLNLHHLQTLGQSNDIFQLNTFVVLVLLSGVTLLTFFHRSHIFPWQLHSYLYVHWLVPYLHARGKLPKNTFIFHGRVVNEQHEPISKATILIFDSQTQVKLHTLTSNRLGLFHFVTQQPLVDYLITTPTHPPLTGQTVASTDSLESTETYTLQPPKNTPSQTLWRNLLALIGTALGLAFEAILALTFIFEAIFAWYFGYQLVILPFCLSLFTLFLWQTYTRSHNKFLK